MPPSCSLVSAYGPSVVATLPFFQYRTRCPGAEEVLRRPDVHSRRWSLCSKHASNIACRSSSDIPSNFPGSMYPKQMYFIVLLLPGGSQLHGVRFFFTVSSNEVQCIPI